jgi:hypothetical protein
MAWRYATWVESIAEAGKKEYALPMYVSAQLPSLLERPGEYPSDTLVKGRILISSTSLVDADGGVTLHA